MSRKGTALVLGATGGIGGEVARQLVSAGWSVRAMARDVAEKMQSDSRFEWVEGDAMNRDDVVAAAGGCSVIVHAVNPPGYKRWAELVLPMIDNTIAAASTCNATIVLPGTVYNYGPSAFPTVLESSPQEPMTKKGTIRVELERRLAAAAKDNRARVIIVRAGDFFGPVVGNSWFSQGLIPPAKSVTKIQVPSAPGVGHQWAYLPDVARTMVKLLDQRDQLAEYELFHLNGHWDADGMQMAQAIQRVVNKRQGIRPKIVRFPWWLIKIIALFNETLRELLEMKYLWDQEVRMKGDRIAMLLGSEPHTLLDEAVEATLVGMGCLPAVGSLHMRSA